MMSTHEKGYEKLASFLAESPILKKYQRLAVRDLLYLQAELCELDHKYQSIAKKNAVENDDREGYSVNWQRLEASRAHGTWGEQWAIAISIREKLREYCMSPSFDPWWET
jgi:hypothetical protein